MLIMLVRGLLVALDAATLAVEVRQLSLDAVADFDDGEVRGGLQHGAGDELALAVDELLVDVGASSVADDLIDHALGALRSDAGDVVRRHVMFFVILIVTGLGVFLADADHLVHIDLARVAIDRDASVPVKLQDFLVALGELLLQTVEHVVLVDIALLGKRCQSLDQLISHA